jgi:hypothetical protein
MQHELLAGASSFLAQEGVFRVQFGEVNLKDPAWIEPKLVRAEQDDAGVLQILLR